ncbi:hypothetical protein NGA_0478000 [Nannochloropsis gaditana CCMP526]|nr:hypothetical protein NGA_0478000 [Nannochloropsis gaditana CCMP526]EKU22629.1 hypothetical protein NGA_0478000 [Nannochloropsis gaditana CCMP526]|eukprot:XP_005853733.1 hypothetical protein NGA_0478000 [Nannochloropsis gaditana CCMP526]
MSKSCHVSTPVDVERI